MCKWFNVEALTGRSFSVSELFVFLFILKFITIPFSAYKDAVEKDEKTDLTQHTLDCIYIVTGLTITLSYALIISTLLY